MKYVGKLASMLNNFVLWAGLLCFSTGLAIISIKQLIAHFDLANAPMVATIISLMVGWALGSTVMPAYKLIMKYES